MKLKKNTRLSVDKVKQGGGSPPSNPVKRPLEAGGPRGCEDRQNVTLYGHRFHPIELGIVAYDLLG